ncbi:hypothetical protein TSPI_03293 [Trichinella spiralis]|uniref:PiggyBac transposable element-derived protein domain-containing protein n=1 Tax=Trichinella spiralis TaxID=6334 RepID=A0ABR3KV05_TRISP
MIGLKVVMTTDFIHSDKCFQIILLLINSPLIFVCFVNKDKRHYLLGLHSMGMKAVKNRLFYKERRLLTDFNEK